MKNIFIYIILSIGYLSCYQPKTSDQLAKEFYNKSNKIPMIYFKNWDMYPRNETNNQYIICDYSKQGKALVRFIVKNYEGRIFIKGIFPAKDKDFLLIDDYPEDKLQKLYINKLDFKLGVKNFYLLELNKVLYRKDFDGLIIVKENLNYAYSFSEKLKSNIPKSYKLLGNNWYYYN